MTNWRLRSFGRGAALLLLSSAFAFPASCYADGGVTGTVEYLRFLDGTVYQGWGSPRFWFSLNGVTSAGTCGIAYGRPIFIGEGKEAYAMVLSAMLTGKEIAVLYSETVKFGSYCRAGAVTLGEPPLVF